ncbi:uncharacterized protein LOC132733728 isoform X2 [Ruditapes philippinarum]|uniref:uncharacterized protein LOC132733728 isoform X2 n=1 Tax=Ruditapes philippinarum TaxID=129788 RepID=UPI00295AA079|nr:uncharacterized protein LOC132733728 isoform X2 [Ruditapes philippinarum]
MGVKSLSNLATVTSEDITMLGSILCGFTASQLGTLPAAEIGKSGVHIGELKECTIEQLSQLEQLSTNVDANGPVSTLEASTVKDLGYVTAGLSATETEKLSWEVTEKPEVDVTQTTPFVAMSTVELKSFAAEAGTNGSGGSLAIGLFTQMFARLSVALLLVLLI